jgi:hypothetical protein
LSGTISLIDRDRPTIDISDNNVLPAVVGNTDA